MEFSLFPRRLRRIALAIVGLTSVLAASGASPTYVVTNTDDAGPGSLREAITYANANPGTAIAFNVPAGALAGGVATIKPASALPNITASGTVIDGTTQAGFTGDTNALGPEVVLDGSLAGFANGISLLSANNLVRGLVIARFSVIGISISGAAATGNRVEGCYIGTDPTGTLPAGNGGGSDPGVAILNASGNTIGGTTAAARNVIAGNAAGTYAGTYAQVRIRAYQLYNPDGSMFWGTATGNVIQGNYVGLRADGSGAVIPAKTDSPAGIKISDASGNTIGGTAPGAGNVISGNGTGVSVIASVGGPGASDNLIQGNYIGTDASGTAKVPNLWGVSLDRAANVVGGTAPGSGNLISGNSPDPSAPWNGGIGVQISNISGSKVQGNLIGTDKNGTGDLGNRKAGIYALTACLIGGPEPGAGNAIAFNGNGGTKDNPSGGIVDATTNGATIQRNSIWKNNGPGIDRYRSLGTGGVSVNDPGDSDFNRFLNFPILESATISGAKLTIAGFARPGSAIELFVADPDPTGFGEGKTYLATLVEGSADDGDSTTGTYSGAINGLNQGTDTTNRFRFTTTLPAPLPVSTALTATATVAGNTSEFSGNVAVAAAPAGPPAKLAFIVPPANAAAGSPISPAVAVSVQDADGNTVDTASNTISLALGSNPSGGTLSGTTTVAAVSGVATFSDLSINRAGAGYTLTASAPGLTGAASVAFDIAAGPASRLAFLAQPSNTVAGVAIAPAVQVGVQDALGNLVSTATHTVTMAIGSGPYPDLLGTKSVAAANGVATFADLKIQRVGGTSYTLAASADGLTAAASAAFAVAPGPPDSLGIIGGFPGNITAGVALSPAITVLVMDAYQNGITTATHAVTISLYNNPTNAMLSGTTTVNAVGGIATFSDLSIDKAGKGYQIMASAPGVSGNITMPFEVAPGAAAKLAFTAQPGNTAAGAAITPPVQVSVQDAFGNTVPTATDSITVALGANPGSGTLSGAQTVAATNGVATFTDLSINKAGTGYTLAATASGLAGGASTAFDILSGAATRLAFAVQPGNAAAGAAIAPAVQVAVLDANGNMVPGATHNVTLAPGANPGGAVLSGKLSVSAVDGIATFADLTLDKVGTGYTLAASASGLSGATSSTFAIIPGAPAKLVFTAQPSNVNAGAAITPAVQVAVQDGSGNVVTGAALTITVGLHANPGSGTLSGALAVTPVGGVAGFPDLSINRAGAGYVLTAAADGLPGATSAAFDVISVNRPPERAELLLPVGGALASPTPTFRARATDPNGDPVRFVIEAGQGTTLKTFDAAAVASGAEASLAVPTDQALGAGEWAWRARAIDPDGAEGEWSGSERFQVPASSPALARVAGLSTLGAPGIVRALRLPGVRIAAWDPVGARYLMNEEIGEIRAGVGYWVRADQPVPVEFAGAAVTEPFAIALKPGWNFISAPFAASVVWDLQALRVRRGASETTLAAARAAGWLEDFAWGWDPTAGRYALVYDTSLIPVVAGGLDPWCSYWVKASVECELVLPPPAPAADRGRERASASDGWAVRLRAQSGGGSAEVVLGAIRRGAPLSAGRPPEPPSASASVRASLVGADGPLSVDVRRSADGAQEWELLVGPNDPAGEGEITLTWPDLRSLPKDLSLTLVDTTTGARRSLRTVASYTFRAGERRFRIVAQRRNAPAVVITGLDLVPGRGARAVRFTLNAAASVDVEVLSPGGRSVAVLARGRAADAGANQVAWGGPAAPGVYLLRAVATTEDGSSVQAIKPVVITR
ncbi:MAG: hypothetical protein HY321_15840 [Armatimonadetes bacterium]|nr:hypothetical protein [Armatimonadota bacterium]